MYAFVHSAMNGKHSTWIVAKEQALCNFQSLTFKTHTLGVYSGAGFGAGSYGKTMLLLAFLCQKKIAVYY